jgi:hypothetical protein
MYDFKRSIFHFPSRKERQSEHWRNGEIDMLREIKCEKFGHSSMRTLA